MVRALVFFAQFYVHEFRFTSWSQSVEHKGIDAGEVDLLALSKCKRIYCHMEVLNRKQGVIYEHIDCVFLPAENVIELVPLVLLLLQEQHRVNVPVSLEVLVVAQPSEEHRLISFDWCLVLNLLFICDLDYVSRSFE